MFQVLPCHSQAMLHQGDCSAKNLKSGLWILIIGLKSVVDKANTAATVPTPLDNSSLSMVLLLNLIYRCREKRAWRLCYGTLLWLVVAITVWLSDRINCNFWLSINFPYLHSLWHIFILLSSYSGCVLCAYLHAKRETPQMNPEIHYWPHNNFVYGVPYVHIDPPIYCP